MFKQTRLTFCDGTLGLSHHSGDNSNNECFKLDTTKVNSNNLRKTAPMKENNDKCNSQKYVAATNLSILCNDIHKQANVQLNRQYNEGCTGFCVGQKSNNGAKKALAVNSASVKKLPRKKIMKTKFKKITPNQLLLDVGKGNLYNVKQCAECKFVFHIGDPGEEAAHEANHNIQKLLHFTGWKRERIVTKLINSRILQVTPNDPKPWINRVKQLLALINRDMGYFDMAADMHFTQVYLFVTNHKIVGCLAVEPTTQGRKLLVNQSGIDICSEEIHAVKCGISIIWVLKEYRKQRVASLLVDSLKKSFIYDYILSNEDIALCSPSESGKKFAQKYFKTFNFYIYGI